MKRHDESREQALSRIRRRDKQSSYRARYLHGVDWQDPSLYDVILNLERISVEGAVETLVQMTGLADFRPTEASLQAFEDLFLGSTVWAELSRNQRTRSATDLRVNARSGQVIITGNADSEQTLKAIYEVALEVIGVREVDCEVGIGWSHWLW